VRTQHQFAHVGGRARSGGEDYVAAGPCDFSHALDSGGHVPLDEVKRELEREQAIAFLMENIPDEYHFAETWYDEGKIAEIDAAMARIHAANGPSEFGIENEGFLYVIALLTEIIQQGDDWVWGPSHRTVPGIADSENDEASEGS